MNTELAADKEIDLLSQIAKGEQVRQRDLSHVIGMSLGMTNAILKRSYHYFKRTIRNIVYYREAIEAFVHDVKSRGYQGITLAGASDLDFVVEHACEICGIRILKDDMAIKAAT